MSSMGVKTRWVVPSAHGRCRATAIRPSRSRRRRPCPSGGRQRLAELLEPLAIARGDVHGGMEVEAAVAGVERHVALDPRRVRVGADAHGTPARATAECRKARDVSPVA